MHKLKYYYKVLRLIAGHFILSERNKMLIGGKILGVLGKFITRPEYVEIAKHIEYKLHKVPMTCELYKFESIPSYDLKNVLVSIVIPTRDRVDDLDTCLKSITNTSTYTNYDIVVIDNQSNGYTKEWLHNCPYNITVVDHDDVYNYAAIHNTVIPDCEGEYIIMLNNDTKVIEPTWIEQLIGPMINDPTIGMTGAKLLFSDHTIQHCGVVYSDVVGGFMHANSHKCDAYPITNVQMVYPAVTGACVAIKRDLYVDLGGMDENLAVAYNDIDLCMKVNDAGYKILYTPYAKLYHYESKSRGYDTTLQKKMIEFKERTYFLEKWGEFIASRFK